MKHTEREKREREGEKRDPPEEYSTVTVWS
jgi:hypothetical protein